jgi:hypothetical protein
LASRSPLSFADLPDATGEFRAQKNPATQEMAGQGRTSRLLFPEGQNLNKPLQLPKRGHL